MNWEKELERRADLAEEAEWAEAQAEHEDRMMAATLRRVFLEIERKRHARLVAALWFALGLSLGANVLLCWGR